MWYPTGLTFFGGLMENFFPYQLLPPLTEEEYQNLKSSISEKGILVPVEFDEDGNILDGHHRIQIAKELGIEYPSIVRTGFTEQEKRSHARTLNTVRRHLNREQKREIIRQELLENPEESNNQIAKRLGVSDTTVGVVRNELGPDAKPSWRKGADGKYYPSSNANKKDENQFVADFSDSEPSTVNGKVDFLKDFFVSDKEIDEEIASHTILETADFKVVSNDKVQSFPQQWVFDWDQRETIFDAIRIAKQEFGIRTGAEAIYLIVNEYLKSRQGTNV